MPEEPLRPAVCLQRRLATFLDESCSDHSVLELFDLLAELEESLLVDWLERRATNLLDAVAAAEAGRLAKRRGWGLVRQRILSRCGTRQNLLSTLRESYDLRH